MQSPYNMYSKKVKISLLFEASWEVCNKVGGIYTVLSTKAKNLRTLYEDKVIFVGPDIWTSENPCPVFKESKSLLKKWRENTTLPYGLTVRVGRWEIPGRPIAVLVKFDALFAYNNDLYARMWEQYGVDSLHAYGDYGEASAFSHAAALVMESIIRFQGLEKATDVVAHFNEWTTGMGLLYLKTVMPKVATVFTTHATSIGRSICGNGKDLYRYFHGYDGDVMARELNMEAKHSVEKIAAHNADCFTTVSDITADECEQLLARRPNIVTPNGFEQNFVPEQPLYEAKRKKARKTLLEVAKALVGADFTDETFIVATSGRCEYRNKGLDVFIDSMKRLSEKNPGSRVVAFVMVPAWLKGPRAELAEALGKKQSAGIEWSYLTHEINNPDTDAVLNHIRNAGFKNEPTSSVSVIYVPCYLNGNDGIFNKCYYELLIGMDATVFPSYYEPWGYTPLESIAFGVPTVTTSLSGFGRWILADFKNDIDVTGVEVVNRNDENYHEVCDAIAETLFSLLKAEPKKRAAISLAAKKTAAAAAWAYFIEYYVEAFRIALTNAKARNKKK